jgi:hypothetical protein
LHLFTTEQLDKDEQSRHVQVLKHWVDKMST